MPTEPSPVTGRYRLEPELLAVGGLVLVTFVVAFNRFIFDNWLARHDLLAFFIPWYGFLGDQLRAGHIPGWMPHLFSGAPFVGDPESGWMYFPAMLFFPLLQATWAFKAMVLAQLLIAGLSTYLYGRLIGLGIYAGLVGAVAYEFGPFLFQNMYCCTVRAQLGTWIPLAFVGVELALLTARWRYRIAAWCIGGIAVSQWLSGFMGQGVVDALILLACYVGYRAIFSSIRAGRSPRQWLIDCASTGAGIVVIGMALGAAGLLVRLAVNQESTIAGGDYGQLNQGHLHEAPYSLDRLLTLIFGSGYDKQAIALGGVVIVLAILAPFLAGRRFGVPFFATMTVVVYILTLNTTPLHRLFYLIPTFQQFHEHRPSQVTAVVLIGPAMLAAATVECLPRWRGKLRGVLYLAVPLLVLALVTVHLAGQRAVVGKLSVAAGLVTIAVLLVSLLVPARLPFGNGVLTRWLPLVLAFGIVMQFAGLQVIQSTFGAQIDSTWTSAYRPNPAIQNGVATNLARNDPGGAGEFLQQQLAKSGPFRFVGYAGLNAKDSPFPWTHYSEGRLDPRVMAILVNDRPIRLGLYDIQGYNPLQLKAYYDYMRVLNGQKTDYHFAMLRTTGVQSPLLDMLNVRYLVVDAGLPSDRSDLAKLANGRKIVFKNSQVVVYENPSAMPHAWLVHDVRQADGMAGAEAFAAGKLDPRVTATVDSAPPHVDAASAPGEDQVTLTNYQPDTMTVNVTAAASGFLVLSEVYEEGWKATIDGNDARLFRTNGALRGVAVPAGEHTVRFTYAPASLKLGLAITGVTVIGMLAVFVATVIGLWFDNRLTILRWYRGPVVRRRLVRGPGTDMAPRPDGGRIRRRPTRIVLRRPPS